MKYNSGTAYGLEQSSARSCSTCFLNLLFPFYPSLHLATNQIYFNSILFPPSFLLLLNPQDTHTHNRNESNQFSESCFLWFSSIIFLLFFNHICSFQRFKIQFCFSFITFWEQILSDTVCSVLLYRHTLLCCTT